MSKKDWVGMTKKQLLLFRVQYFVYQVTEVITIPLFLLLGIPILLGIRRKRMQNIFDRFEDQISAWGEKLRLYKETGHRYRTVEIRYPIFEDRRPEAIKTLDHYIIPERSLFGKDTIVYFEPFDCPEIRSVIQRRFVDLQAYSQVKSLFFLYWPMLDQINGDLEGWKQFKKSLIITENKFDPDNDFSWDPQGVCKLIHGWLAKEGLREPCLICSNGIIDARTGHLVYEVFVLPRKRRSAIRNAVYYFIYKVPDRGDHIYY